MQLRNKVVFITGGASGIGAACAKALVENEAKVIIADINDELGEKVAGELNNSSGEARIIFVHCDVTDQSQFKDAFLKAITTFKQVDIMVNNAGIANERNFGKVLDINIKGTISGTEIALAHMRKDKGGQGGVIINMASVMGFRPLFFAPAYAASKHAVIGYTRSMATAPDLDTLGVRYACICPDLVDTPIHDNSGNACREDYLELTREFVGQEKLSSDKVAEGLLSLIADDDSNDTLLSMSVAEGQVNKKIIVEDV